jgi:membrane protease subunit (stomatin/prohibitin family)
VPKTNEQNLFFRGIYEFQDPSGSLICARVPYDGNADLYEGSAIFVRPNQGVIFVHKGQVADFLGPGTHSLKSENFPILTRLANLKFGFKSPIRSELYFFSSSQFLGRRWGTNQPVFAEIDGKPLPIRAYGNFNIRLVDPKKFYLKLMASRASFSISEIEEFVQGVLIEQFPNALKCVKALKDLSGKQKAISSLLETLAKTALKDYGLQVESIQVLSVLPSKEILQAMDASAAMEIIGDKREFLLYKAASTLDSLQSGGGNQAKGDPMHMMMGLMLGKNLLASDYKQKENKAPIAIQSNAACKNCGQSNSVEFRFCPKCGKELA